MEALWNLEDKWKLSTKRAAVILFVCSSCLAICLYAATVLRKRAQRMRINNREQSTDEPTEENWSEPGPEWDGSANKVLISSVRWSGASKWDQSIRGSRKVRPMPLLVRGSCETDVGWQSHNSTSPVWQRPILMGEKCELPRFSGLILYDERGRPLHHSDRENTHHQGSPPTVERTTLRDLL